MTVLEPVLAAIALAGAIPLLAGCYQFLLAGFDGVRRKPEPLPAGTEPRVAVVVPAWNEAAVIGRTIETLTGLDYPPDRLRVYVVDDASTDATPELVQAAERAHPGRVVHLRREKGGEGKAHTINHGLRTIRAEGWYQAVLIIDADVIFTERSLRKMVRHFADPGVGAVTAYIKEGSRPANWMNRFISYEYVNAQAGARRAQNVLGALACLAGGAQLLRREALEAIGGVIDTSSLAEDTFTTLNVQLSGRRVVFEPHAVVWAEEPRGIDGLWKQRLRWGRGNVQVTLRFRHIWLRRRRAGRLGSLGFALIWFSVFLMPVFMVSSSAALIALFVHDPDFSLGVFKALWFVNLATYLFITAMSFSLDPAVARTTWREGLLFPGLVSLAIMAYATIPGISAAWGSTAVLLFSYVWLTASMGAAWLARRVESVPGLRWASAPLLYLVGYGPLLCAITAAAYVKEARGAEMVWDKTEKVGNVGAAY
ncbi:MAG TPA: glycosyltransferase family 2 protein [Capillimicrobium sp.]|jgi:cellulose synthase/poly-beta-1,6-N-acetylglucosamine synthase-like glycosyltransferase